ncbi:MAG: hypothetical protein COA69_03610 [Robiginitomaculum sp.]|nr:MAG: hypothetical protein COA69_03610 [Robiginitomaculum sp.]
MFERFFLGRLSGKLLAMTIVFVMLAEVVIFIPSASMFRQNWLQERAEAAGLLTLAIEGVPNYEGGEMLSDQFMHDTSVSMVAQMRAGLPHGEDARQIVLGVPPINSKIYTTDLRKKRRLPLFRDSFRDFFGNSHGYIRILSEPTVKGVQTLVIYVPRSALKMALQDYCQRVLLWSLAISVLTGLMIYLALSRMIVRPVHTLAQDMAAFRTDPRKRIIPSTPNARRDEIGQLQREFVDMRDGVRTVFKQQERLATLGMAMAKINHDLRNVLTSTQLISDRLADDPDEKISKMGKRLVRAVDRGVKLCEATLSFSQSVEERPQPRNTKLAPLIDDAIIDCIAEEDKAETAIQFTNHIDRKLQIFADPDHTYRIFLNLLRNAVQAMQDSEIKTLNVEASEIDGKILIRIADTGPGLPSKAKENLFKAFTSSTHAGGTGLGLTISRELARAQGGNLQLESTGADGTVFLVGLPAQKNAA